MFQQFLNTYNGKFVDFDGAYGNQCFDLVNKWSTYLGYQPFGGLYASGIYNQPQGNYSQIPNSPTAVPQAGDIIVWNNRYGGGFGHTGIATGEGDTNYFVSFDQNYPTGSPSKPVRHSYDGVIGWLRPNKLNVSGDNDMMNQGENEYARASKLHEQVRGRGLDRAVFNQLAGKITWLRYIEILSDDPEANNWQENGKVGAVARRDNWQQQIYSLQDQLKAANDALAAAKQKPVDVPPVKVEPPTQGFTPAPVPVPVESPAKPNQSIFDTLIEAILSLFSKGKK